MSLNTLLSQNDFDKIREWDIEQQKEMPRDEDGNLLVGAIGGYLTYEFTPTSLGLIKKIKNNVTGNVIDITEYGSW